MVFKGAVLRFMLATNDRAPGQRESLLRVIAAILHFSNGEAADAERAIKDEAAASEDPVGTAIASSLAGWGAVSTSLFGGVAEVAVPPSPSRPQRPAGDLA